MLEDQGHHLIQNVRVQLGAQGDLGQNHVAHGLHRRGGLHTPRVRVCVSCMDAPLESDKRRAHDAPRRT